VGVQQAYGGQKRCFLAGENIWQPPLLGNSSDNWGQCQEKKAHCAGPHPSPECPPWGARSAWASKTCSHRHLEITKSSCGLPRSVPIAWFPTHVLPPSFSTHSLSPGGFLISFLTLTVLQGPPYPWASGLHPIASIFTCYCLGHAISSGLFPKILLWIFNRQKSWKDFAVTPQMPTT
jgi:hypothetical protein